MVTERGDARGSLGLTLTAVLAVVVGAGVGGGATVGAGAGAAEATGTALWQASMLTIAAKLTAVRICCPTILDSSAIHG